MYHADLNTWQGLLLALANTIFTFSTATVSLWLGVYQDFDAHEWLKILFKKSRIWVTVNSKSGKLIRSQIQAHLADKDPRQGVSCPYNTKTGTLFGRAIETIWKEECDRRCDELLLSTDILQS